MVATLNLDGGNFGNIQGHVNALSRLCSCNNTGVRGEVSMQRHDKGSKGARSSCCTDCFKSC